MIHYLEKGFHARLRPGVIERRPEVHEQHRHSKNDRPDKKKGAGMAEGCQKQNRHADHRPHDSYREADTIRQFLATWLRPRQRSLWTFNTIPGRHHATLFEQLAIRNQRLSSMSQQRWRAS